MSDEQAVYEFRAKPKLKLADGEAVEVPCPVCGVPQGIIRISKGKYRIECPECDYQTPPHREWEHVLNDWENGGMKVRAGKKELEGKPLPDLKAAVEKDAWIALKQYFDGAGNGAEAKVACVVVGTLAREEQARNNARQLDLLERRFLLEPPKPKDFADETNTRD